MQSGLALVYHFGRLYLCGRRWIRDNGPGFLGIVTA